MKKWTSPMRDEAITRGEGVRYIIKFRWTHPWILKILSKTGWHVKMAALWWWLACEARGGRRRRLFLARSDWAFRWRASSRWKTLGAVSESALDRHISLPFSLNFNIGWCVCTGCWAQFGESNHLALRWKSWLGSFPVPPSFVNA